jgi:hypothetical protein
VEKEDYIEGSHFAKYLCGCEQFAKVNSFFYFPLTHFTLSQISAMKAIYDDESQSRVLTINISH